jgi:hypothetical protein
MRTKTILSVAAALAVGAFAAQAQSNVYSVNIVGYVNQVLPAGQLVAVANPLDNGTNDLNSVFGGVAKTSVAQFWNGSGFTPSQKGGTGWSPNTATPVGMGLFISSAQDVTNTYVGEVVVGPGENVTNSLPVGLSLVGSPLPMAGTLNSPELGLLGVAKTSTAQFWNGSGYTPSQKGGTGWTPDLSIGVAEGFFISPVQAYDWVQTLPSN